MSEHVHKIDCLLLDTDPEHVGWCPTEREAAVSADAETEDEPILYHSPCEHCSERAPFGRVLWSDYFESRIVVVAYQDDDNWWFVAEKSAYPGTVHKAQIKLSKMGERDGSTTSITT